MDKTLARLSGEMNPIDARLLTEAGFKTPHDIKTATSEQLLAIPGVGRVTLKRIRRWMPRVK